MMWNDLSFKQIFLYIRGSQPFGTCVPPNKNFTPLRTPKSELFPICVPQNKKFYLNELLLGSFLMLRTLCEHLLSVYPLRASNVPLGVHVPQVENRCFISSNPCFVYLDNGHYDIQNKANPKN
jgi:hypothetical protein